MTHLQHLSLFKEQRHRRAFIGNRVITQLFKAFLNFSATACSVNNFLVNLEHFED